MSKQKSYRDLVVWQKAMSLVTAIYQVTAGFPTREVYGLTDQIRRAAVSIPSNIAEGQGRGTAKEFAYSLRVTMGSIQELETQLLIAQELGYLDGTAAESLIQGVHEVARMVRGLIRAL